MGKPWFRVKRYGYGAGLPCSWEGWVALAVFFAIVIGGGLFAGENTGLRIVLLILPAVAFVVLAWRKSDAPWKWRNGEDV